MPSRPTTGPWGLLIIRGASDQKEWSNDFWFSISAGTPSGSWNQLNAAQAILAALTANFFDALQQNSKVLGATFYYNDGVGTIGVDYYATVDGLDVGDPLPEDIAVVVQKITANTTREGRGRWYVTGIPASSLTGSYLNSSGIALYATVATDWKTAITDQGVTWSPAHFSPSTGLLYPITNTPVIALIGTRRRRRFGF
jgi:hypothetical protein